MRDTYTYKIAKRVHPYLRTIEDYAFEKREEGYSSEIEKELYEKLRSQNSRLYQESKMKLVEGHMYVVICFMDRYPYLFSATQDVEDMLQSGFVILLEVVDCWNIKKGSFKTLLNIHLHKLHRLYWKNSSLQPQTNMQQDAIVKRYDEACRLMIGKIVSAEEAAKALGKTTRAVEKARDRNKYQSGKLFSLDQLTEQCPWDEFCMLSETNEEGVTNCLFSEMEQDFVDLAKKALKGNPSAVTVFDFLMHDDNYKLSVQQLADAIKEQTGLSYTYQQIYRLKRSIADTLFQNGLLDRKYIADTGKLKKKK